MAAETILRIEVRADSPAVLREFLRHHPLDLGCGPPKKSPDGTLVLEALVPSGALDEVRDGPWRVTVVEDAAAAGVRGQRQVGHGDRFARRGGVPRGLGIKE